ncbi:MAG: sulfatase-like hydrolase/transferase [Vicinamibacterales bacterium]
MARRGRAAARVIVTLFCLLTSAYALVASSTFAYLQFIRPRVFPWTGLFADAHATLSLAWFALLAALVVPDARRSAATRLPARLLLAASAGAVAWLQYAPLLPALEADGRSVQVAIAALFPVIGLAALDHLRHQTMLWGEGGAGATEPEDHDSRLFAACGMTAAMVTSVFLAIALVKQARAFEPDLSLDRLAYAGWRSLTIHALAFGGVFLGLALWSRVSRGGGWREHLAWLVLFGAAIALGFDALVGNVLNLSGGVRWILAGTVAFTLVSTWAGIRLSAAADRSPAARGLDLLFGRSASRWSRESLLVSFAGFTALAWVLLAAADVADWDRLLQRVGVGVIWGAGLVWAYRTARPVRRIRPSMMAAACLLPLALHVGVRAETDGGRAALARYAIYDPSFWVIDSALRPAPSAPAFDRYLRANTGLTDVTVDPVAIDLVTPLTPASTPPHIFLFVVDSLRPDYLSPYNPAVGFTPGLAAFARDSVVFTNAFTRYGGTGLSVPAIWAGSALPHKQYVTPFHPMNALEKLLDANGYRRIQSFDNIMNPLFRPGAPIEDVGRGRGDLDIELCRTLEQLAPAVARAPAGTPIFGYSRPLDVHMSQMSRWATPEGDFTGFFAPYAGRVRSLDACFGRFIEALERLGLYDDSLIVFTADHGEMLGEDGQYGHSYHLFPPVVQIPLIVHLPRRARASWDAETAGLAMSTDITPTLYALLGYHPVTSSLSGRSLFHRRGVAGEDGDGARRRAADVQVIAASYGAVYAVLSEQGHRLYIANAVKGGEHLFERGAAGAWVERAVHADERAVEQYAIRRHVDEVADRYRLPTRHQDFP